MGRIPHAPSYPRGQRVSVRSQERIGRDRRSEPAGKLLPVSTRSEMPSGRDLLAASAIGGREFPSPKRCEVVTILHRRRQLSAVGVSVRSEMRSGRDQNYDTEKAMILVSVRLEMQSSRDRISLIGGPFAKFPSAQRCGVVAIWRVWSARFVAVSFRPLRDAA